MQILTAKEMAEADKRSVEIGVPIAKLMENAGAAVARFCDRHYPQSYVVVVCGKGNNGGDGMVAARHLAEASHNVKLVLLGKASDLKDDVAKAWERASGCTEQIEVNEEAALPKALDLVNASLIIDAIVGTGFKPPLRELASATRDLIAKAKATVVAVDLPSGWDADSMKQSNPQAFRADAVVTFATPKLAHVFGHLTHGKVFAPVVVAGIGTPKEALQSAGHMTWAGSSKSVAETPRDINGNKGKFGHVMIVGGALGKSGAPSMASLAGMRTGAGLVTAAVTRDVLPIVATLAPELMATTIKVEPSQAQEDELKKLLKGITVVGIGPGLGTEGETPAFVRKFIENTRLPMVIDADALNAIASDTSILTAASKKLDANGQPRTLVLTPHPGEMARLVNLTVKEVEADRINIARSFATTHGVTLVLKGWRTLIAHPDGRLGVNTTGNPAMAKGGSGDILTGIVSAMLAQYPDAVAKAVEAAVYLHGLAGDFAALVQDEHTILATDTVDHLWQAFRARVTDADGFTWITGAAR